MNPAIFNSSSINANNYIRSFQSPTAVGQRIFRVQKNRIIHSFDLLQQAGYDNDLKTSVHTLIRNTVTEMNDIHSQVIIILIMKYQRKLFSIDN